MVFSVRCSQPAAQACEDADGVHSGFSNKLPETHPQTLTGT
jgi:hypothetical protein